jgi:glycosyltransferase involved in cell wall biosynthesis
VATVRIYIPTYRREHLLKRAVESLRSQSFSDWICEVHNDDPSDGSIRSLVDSLADPRFVLDQHPRNLGGTATFNLFFRPIREPFFSILEDDNWWQPEFLMKMLDAAGAFPDASVFWANMRIWEERPDGSWRDTGGHVCPIPQDDSPRRVAWGQAAQLHSALHSNSATLFRSVPGRDYSIPDVPISVTEMFRERLFPFPLVFMPQSLANFSHTLHTARSDDRGEWAAMQAMLAATFIKYAGYSDERLAALWAHARAQHPPTTSVLLLASFLDPSCLGLRRHARCRDWLLLSRGALRRPWVLRRVLSVRRRYPRWWDFLDRSTSARFAESRSNARPA